MVGISIFGVAHALMATRLTGTVFFSGFVVLAVVGSLHQDRRLLRARGAPYAGYLEQTSFFPAAAIVAGRQRLALSELPWVGFIGGVLAAAVIRWMHAHVWALAGVPFALLLLLPAWWFTYRAFRKMGRQRAATPGAAVKGR